MIAERQAPNDDTKTYVDMHFCKPNLKCPPYDDHDVDTMRGKTFGGRGVIDVVKLSSIKQMMVHRGNLGEIGMDERTMLAARDPQLYLLQTKREPHIRRGIMPPVFTSSVGSALAIVAN